MTPKSPTSRLLGPRWSSLTRILAVASVAALLVTGLITRRFSQEHLLPHKVIDQTDSQRSGLGLGLVVVTHVRETKPPADSSDKRIQELLTAWEEAVRCQNRAQNPFAASNPWAGMPNVTDGESVVSDTAEV